MRLHNFFVFFNLSLFTYLMSYISLKIPIPNTLALIALAPILLYRRLKFGFSFMRIKLSRGLFAIVNGRDFLKLYMFKWFAKGDGGTFYAIRTFYENGRKKQVSMHRQIMNPTEGFCIDHRNHIGLDNRRINLREATQTQNSHNRRKSTTCSSIYKGVVWKECHKKWRASIKVNGQTISLGYFDNEIDAAKAYDAAAKEHFGKFASLNFDPLANEISDEHKKLIFNL